MTHNNDLTLDCVDQGTIYLSIKYVTLFLANFNPSVILCHTPRDPQKYVTHLGPHIFSRPSTKRPDKSTLYKFSLNYSQRFLSGVFVGGFVWKVLSGVDFFRSPFVRIHLLQKKVKHHFIISSFICMIRNL